jgi:hypothetical protein
MGLTLSDEQPAAVDSHAQQVCILACAGAGHARRQTRSTSGPTERVGRPARKCRIGKTPLHCTMVSLRILQ